MVNPKIMTSICKSEMAEVFGLTFDAEFGDDFLNSLFYGTLKSFTDRVDSSGFCHTSYGEDGGVKCYGTTHYPRDASEASWVLSSVGLFGLAESIIDFTLRNIPSGQAYIPHVYNRDGSIKANTVQVDTPGIVAVALGRLIELDGPTDSRKKLFDKLVQIMQATFDSHFQPKWNLLDAGNFNEQFGGGSEQICDIFTNSAMFAGYKAMASAAVCFGVSQHVMADMDTKASILAEGIEKTLYDSENDCYRPMLNCGDETRGDINWHSLYCRRWYQGRFAAFENAYETLKSTTTVKWGDSYKIVGGRLGLEHCILGKIFGMFCGYMGQIGRVKDLRHHLDFARATIRKPANIFPEWWYCRKDKRKSEYWNGFWAKYSGIWDNYEDNPDGDYTVDSGNCEQCAVFLNHAISDLLGIRTAGGKVTLSPAMPNEYSPLAARNVPVGRKQSISYTLEYVDGLPRLFISGMACEDVTVRLHIEDVTMKKCLINRENAVFSIRHQNDVNVLEVNIGSLNSEMEIVCQ